MSLPNNYHLSALLPSPVARCLRVNNPMWTYLRLIKQHPRQFWNSDWTYFFTSKRGCVQVKEDSWSPYPRQETKNLPSGTCVVSISPVPPLLNFICISFWPICFWKPVFCPSVVLSLRLLFNIVNKCRRRPEKWPQKANLSDHIICHPHFYKPCSMLNEKTEDQLTILTQRRPLLIKHHAHAAMYFFLANLPLLYHVYILGNSYHLFGLFIYTDSGYTRRPNKRPPFSAGS